MAGSMVDSSMVDSSMVDSSMVDSRDTVDNEIHDDPCYIHVFDFGHWGVYFLCAAHK